MSTAEPLDHTPRMTLERVIEFEGPITGLEVHDQPGDPLILARMGSDAPMVVHANTGDRYLGEGGLTWRKGFAGTHRTSVAGLLAEANQGDVLIFNFSSETPRSTLRAHTKRITTLGVCDRLLVTAGESGNIRLWDVRTGVQQRVGVQQSPVTSLVSYAGPDGRPRIASSGERGTLHIWDPQLPFASRIGPVATRGFDDRVAQEDLLGRGTLVRALTDVLRPDDDDGPTVITVEGAWGSGKSTLLELVKNHLHTPPTKIQRRRRFTVCQADWMLYRPPAGMPPPKHEPTKFKPMINPLVVSFNPWRHQSSEQVWAGLARTVTEAAEAAIMSHQNNRERYWFARNAGRVDRRLLQRQLWKRIFSPLLTFAGLGFGLSLLGALTKLNLTWAFWPSVGIAGLGVLHTVMRYLFGLASAFLPGELFAGPVTSNAFSGITTDPLIRDPYYNARSGYLYLVQHDIRELLKNLEAHRYRLILLIDDLDRCTPRTTAQVFEAINVFLSDDFPATRFVLGLDTTVVAAHVDNAYKELADAKIVTHPDDPSPGWTFLRKLVQLPVRLPRTTEDNVDQILLAQLGPVHREAFAHSIVMGAGGGGVNMSAAASAAVAAALDQAVVAIERHAEVRDRLRHRLRAQPEQSVREEKRLLNVWQFYLRVLSSAHVEQACHLVAVAEIAVRWPAYLHRLRGGWQDLADAVGDDVQWGATIAKLGFAYSDRKAAANLRDLLLDCDAQAVANLANRLF